MKLRKRFERLTLTRDSVWGEVAVVSIWRWGINFNEGQMALPALPFTFYFGTVGSSSVERIMLHAYLLGGAITKNWYR